MKPTPPDVKHPLQRPTARKAIHRVRAGVPEPAQDLLAREEPLEIRVLEAGAARPRRLSVTMRTPGHDPELAAGFLFSEGIIQRAQDVGGIDHEPEPGEEQEFNSVLVRLSTARTVDWARMERPFVMTSACGVCGRASMDFLHATCSPVPPGPTISSSVLGELPERLREAQTVFEATGGLHAAGLFDPRGRLLAIREDVGRHNAVDKLVGRLLFEERIPVEGAALLVSGRASYEILQKAIRAGIGFVCAVGAPSSLAVELAEEFGATLVAFLRRDRFNVYCGLERVRG